MISFDDAIQTMERPEIRDLDLSMFKEPDLVNVMLHRSRILSDLPAPNSIIAAWRSGDSRPALTAVDALGTDLAKRAAAYTLLEYEGLQRDLDGTSPGYAADIGCGYGFFDLFLYRFHRCRLLLIDTERNDERIYGKSGSTLETATAFLTGNGVPKTKITARNPDVTPLSRLRGVDLAVSFLACGFHFPVEHYAEFFDTTVRPGGTVILDLRAQWAEAELETLGAHGQAEPLGVAVGSKAHRVRLHTRGGSARKRIAAAA